MLIKKLAGFSLIELMVTLAIMAVLATVALPMAQLTLQRNKEHELRTALIKIREALDAYKQAADEGRITKMTGDTGYPHALSDLYQGIDDIKDPRRTKIYFLRSLPRDPMHPNPALQAELTWGTRSYESPPNEPQPGKDIFDVYSLSDATGLNGIAYREW